MISAVYPNFELTQERLDVWAELLESDYWEDIRAVTLDYLRSGQGFPPTPGQLIEAARERLREQRRREAHESFERRETQAAIDTPMSDEARARVKALLRDCIAKLEAKKR